MYGTAALRRDFLFSQPRARIMYLNSELPSQQLTCVIAIGAFDGVHLGHRHLLQQAVNDARERGIAAVAVTFDPDPDVVVSDEPAPKLMSLDDRLRTLASVGIDAVAVVPFDANVAAMDHEAFFERIVAPALRVRAIHVGTDFRLGARGSATVDVLRSWGEARGIEVFGHELLREAGGTVSSSRIRALLAQGDVDSANADLGRTHMVRGRVVHGRGEGRKLGFPTANIEVSGRMATPQEGVYAGFACLGDSAWPAAINVGVPPMFKDCAASAKLEANIIGFSDDIYGAQIAVSFVKQLRPSRTFASLDELVATVEGNIEDVRELFGEGRRDLSL